MLAVHQPTSDTSDADADAAAKQREQATLEKARHDAYKNLYRLTWTVVTCAVHHFEGVEESDTSTKLQSLTQTLIVEAVDKPPVVNEDGDRLWHGSMPNNGMMMSGWLKKKMPYIINSAGGELLIIVHSIEPYKKRCSSCLNQLREAQ